MKLINKIVYFYCLLFYQSKRFYTDTKKVKFQTQIMCNKKKKLCQNNVFLHIFLDSKEGDFGVWLH